MMRGKVTAVDANGVYVQTAEYGTLGPCQAVVANYYVGSMVLCVNVGDEASPELVVVGRLTGTGSTTSVSSVDNTVARFDGTGGALQGSGVTIDDNADVTGIRNLHAHGAGNYLRVSSTTAGASLYLDGGAPGQWSQTMFRTITDTPKNRWALWKTEAAESGGNAGSDLKLTRYNDAGTSLGDAITVNRASGKFTVGSVGGTAGLEFGSNGPRMMAGTGGPSGINAPVGSTWRQTNANASHGSLTGLLWNKVGTGTTEGTDWLVDYEGRWVSYTPTMIGATTNPTITTKDGRYTRSGKTCWYKFRFVTWTAAGSGTYYVPLPVNANTTQAWASGNVYIYDASSGNGYNGFVYVGSPTYLGMIYPLPSGSTGLVASSAPWGWTTNDEISGQVTYEIA